MRLNTLRSLPHKQRWFSDAQSATARVYGTASGCRCPLCGQLAPGLEDMSEEHVPPGSVGGAPLCLTCWHCNSTAGHQYDYAVAELVRAGKFGRALAQPGAEYRGPARVTFGGIAVNAEVIMAGGGVTLVTRRHNNNPANVDSQIQQISAVVERPVSEVSVDLTTHFAFSLRLVRLSLLRAAFLSAFALYGYRYALSKPLAIVREQLARPEAELVPACCLNVAGEDLGLGEPMLMAMSKPLDGIAVYFPALAGIPLPVWIVLPPPHGREDFYAACEECYTPAADRRRAPFVGTPIGWPREPMHLLDFGWRSPAPIAVPPNEALKLTKPRTVPR